jgi:DHA1 family bicyclomycin/chloramphenicol resistance-like MFS transporter
MFVNTKTLTLLLAGLAMIGPFATDTYLPSFPAIAAQFEVTAAMVQQTLSIYLAGFALMTLFYGTLSDSFGRKPVILGSLLLFSAASVGATLAPSFGWLLAFRLMQGLSAGAGMVVGQAIVRDRVSGADAQRMIANIMMVFGVAPAIAPVVGGFLHVSLGWRANFGFMALIGLGLLLAVSRGLTESLAPASRQPFRFTAIAANYLMAIRHPQFLLRCLGIGVTFGGFALYIASAANFVIEVLHLAETSFAWLFLPLIGGIVLGSIITGKLAHKVAPAKSIRVGFVIMGAAAVINLVYTANAVAVVPWAVLPLFLYSFGLALALPGMAMLTLGLFPAMRGLAASLQNFVQMAIFALVSAFVAPLVPDSAFKLAVGLAAGVVLGGLCWKLGNRTVSQTVTAQA